MSTLIEAAVLIFLVVWVLWYPPAFKLWWGILPPRKERDELDHRD